MRMLIGAMLMAAACGGGAAPVRAVGPAPVEETEQDRFWASLTALCGQAFDGVITANAGGKTPDPMEGKRLRMHVRDCAEREIRVPFQVGDDRSRVWVFTRGDGGLHLAHDHRHEDGTPDAVTMYGGTALEGGTATEQRFPADAATRDLFVREGLEVSVPNTWIVTLVPGALYRYALTRPGRDFRVDFDLSAPVEAPPPPWGARN